MNLLLLDGNCLLWRSAFAGKSLPLVDDQGYMQVVAFHHFVELIDQLEKKFDARSLLILDGGSDFRKAIDPNYKGNRSQVSEERALVRKAFRLVVSALESVGGNHILVNGVEADDIISILARRCRKKGVRAIIVADDRDLYQCLGDPVTQYHPKKEIEVTKDQALADFGSCVKTYLIWKALCGGDDNIPGFDGIGKVKALELALFCQGDWQRLFNEEAASVYGKKKAYASLFAPNAPKLFSDQIRLVRTAIEVDDLGPWPLDPPSGQSLVPGAVASAIERALEQLKSPRAVGRDDWMAFLKRYDCAYLKDSIERIFAIDSTASIYATDVHGPVCAAPRRS